MELIWAPFQEWVTANFPYSGGIRISSKPGNEWWVYRDGDSSKVPSPYDPSEPDRAFLWSVNKNELSRYGVVYASRYITSDQLTDSDQMASNLIKLARTAGHLQLHINKGQAQASDWAREELSKTPVHPSVNEFRDATPGSGAYFGESDYFDFEPNLQEAF